MILEELEKAPAVKDMASAYRLLVHTIDTVEDRFSNVSFDPHYPRDDGRLYPPLEDNARFIDEACRIRRFRSARHETLLGLNGAICIRSLFASQGVLLDKPGADGLTVLEQK